MDMVFDGEDINRVAEEILSDNSTGGTDVTEVELPAGLKDTDYAAWQDEKITLQLFGEDTPENRKRLKFLTKKLSDSAAESEFDLLREIFGEPKKICTDDMLKIIDKHIDAWDPIGIADCDVHEYDIEVSEIGGCLAMEEVITLGGLTKIIHDVFRKYFGKGTFSNIFLRKNTFAETRAVAEKILADLKAQGLKVSDEYEISAEEELERLQLEELKILTETYSEDRFNTDVPFTFRALVESIFMANQYKRGREVAEKILAAFDPPEKILQASQERLDELIFPNGNLRARGKMLFKILKILAERDKLPETFTEFLMLPNLDDNLAAKIKYGLIVNSDADFYEHVLRVATRMKIAEAERPVRVPQNLQPKLFRHGKEICTEHEPKCKICPLSKICPSRI
ncbi:MAG: hypothetical protein IJR52_09995 [Selenomonadaceae bacterium]|nr:hypothetical protein [Selenomonadaceae bacterium]